MVRWTIACLSLAILAPAALRAEDDPKAIIAKAIKAHGGEDVITKYKASQVKGKATMSAGGMDLEVALAMSSQLPDKIRQDITLDIMGQKVNVVQVFDGKKGWAKAMGMLMELDGDQLNEMKELAYGNYAESLVPLLKDKDFNLTLVGEAKVEGKSAVGVKITSKGHKDMTLFFDKESGLLVMKRSKSKDLSQQEVDAEAYYLGYKSVNGLQQPFKMLVKHDGKDFLKGELTEIKVMEKLDDSVFGKPE